MNDIKVLVMEKMKFLYGLFVSLLFVACFDDKGNYDYHEVADITINNIPEQIEVIGSSDHIIVEPEVVSSLEGKITDDNSNFEFSYKIEKANGGYLGSDPWIDLNPSKSLKLDTLAAFPPDDYLGVFTVKDLRTNIETIKTFNVKVTSSVYEGWMILCNEGEGNRVRMDMISVISSDRFVFAYDLLAPLGLPEMKEARGIGFYPNNYSSGDIIYVMSEEGAYLINNEDFSTDESWNIFYNDFIVPPENEHIVSYSTVNNDNTVRAVAALCVSKEGNAYAQIYGTAGAAFEEPINTSVRGGEPEYKVAPYIGTSMARPGNSDAALLYDIDNMRFVGWRYNEEVEDANQVLFPLLDENAPTGMQLVYMESTRYLGGIVYAILQDAAGHRSVYGINMSGEGFVWELEYENLNAPDFDKATLFAFHSQYPFMFYMAENKVYLHNLGTNRSYLMDNVELDDSEQITMLKFNLYKQCSLSDLNNQSDEFMARQYELMIGSYDTSVEGNNGGCLSFYTVDGADNSIRKRVDYSGFARIVDVVYRERR